MSKGTGGKQRHKIKASKRKNAKAYDPIVPRYMRIKPKPSLSGVARKTAP